MQTINIHIIEVVDEGGYANTSVHMSGQLRENKDMLENFNEIGHVQKNLRDGKAVWLLSEIQRAA